MSESFSKEGCCRCILKIKQQIRDIYSRLQNGSVNSLNAVTGSLNRISSPISQSLEDKLGKLADKLTDKYQQIADGLSSRKEPLERKTDDTCRQCIANAVQSSPKQSLQDYWDSLKPSLDQPAPIMTPERRDLIDQPLKVQEGRELPPPPKGTPLPEPTHTGSDKCPKCYGLICCPQNVVQIVIDDFDKYQKDIDKLKIPEMIPSPGFPPDNEPTPNFTPTEESVESGEIE